MAEHRNRGVAAGLAGYGLAPPGRANGKVATAGTVPGVAGATVDREPYFFGPRDARLFGCYHPAVGRTDARSAVVLCPPLGQEYIRSHRTYVQLATRLARAGFHVLRFDLRGTGDSSGELEDARIKAWIEDVHRACDHLRELSGTPRLHLMGLRIGAALAWLTAAGRTDVDRVVLWEPVISGRAYLRELREHQRQLLSTAYVDRRAGGDPDALTEALGFAFPAGLRDDIVALDLLQGPLPPVRTLIVESTGNGESDGQLSGALSRRARDIGAIIDIENVDAPRVWLEEPFRALVPHKVIVCIEHWLTRTPR